MSNSIEQVTIDHVSAHPSMRNYAPVGIYMDNQTYGQSFKNVKLTNVGGGTLFTNNESSNHTNVNVNWTGSFDDTKMEYSSIGVKADFPAEYR